MSTVGLGTLITTALAYDAKSHSLVLNREINSLKYDIQMRGAAYVILPLLLTGKFPTYALLFTTIYVSYIIGDLIAIPFSYVFAKQPAVEMELQ